MYVFSIFKINLNLAPRLGCEQKLIPQQFSLSRLESVISNTPKMLKLETSYCILFTLILNFNMKLACLFEKALHYKLLGCPKLTLTTYKTKSRYVGAYIFCPINCFCYTSCLLFS